MLATARFCGVLPRYTWTETATLDTDIQESRFTHKSNAEELIIQVPPVEVEGHIARCTGVNEMGYGHPVHYIQLDVQNPHKAVKCKWCGLRYKMAGH